MNKTLCAVVAAMACATVLGPISANAATLNITATADNQFTVYLATAAQIASNQLGTQIGSNPAGANWQTAFTLPSTGLSGSPLYVQVVVTNWTPDNGYPQYPYSATSNPSAFIADLSISGGGYVFTNGGTSLSTNTVNWLGATTGAPGTWSPTGIGVASYGSNAGPSIWYSAYGSVPGISLGADWIYFGDQSTALYADLSTEILATPLPSTWTMLIAGFLGLGYFAYRGTKKGSATLAAA